MRIIHFLAAVFFLISCDSNKICLESSTGLEIITITPEKMSLTQMAPKIIYTPPLITTIDVIQGYIVHPITRDTVKSLINAVDDTLITGKLIPVRGKVSVAEEHIFTNKPTGKVTRLALNYDIMKARGGDIQIKSAKGEDRPVWPGRTERSIYHHLKDQLIAYAEFFTVTIS